MNLKCFRHYLHLFAKPGNGHLILSFLLGVPLSMILIGSTQMMVNRGWQLHFLVFCCSLICGLIHTLVRSLMITIYVSYLRLHQMHEMQAIVTDVHVVCQSVYQSVCHSGSTSSVSLCGGHLVQPLQNYCGILFSHGLYAVKFCCLFLGNLLLHYFADFILLYFSDVMDHLVSSNSYFIENFGCIFGVFVFKFCC